VTCNRGLVEKRGGPAAFSLPVAMAWNSDIEGRLVSALTRS
jgi:hypothetical protein